MTITLSSHCDQRTLGLRQLIIAAAVVVVVLFRLSFAVRATPIEAGPVGVEIDLAGRQRGASEIPVRTGWVVGLSLGGDRGRNRLFAAGDADDRIFDLRAKETAKEIAEADGDANSMVTRPQREAGANRIRQNSRTPQLLNLRGIENSRAVLD